MCSKNVCVQSNVLERAVDWIFSHLDDLESMEVSEGGRSEGASEANRDPPPGPRVRDGPGSESNSCVYVVVFDLMVG